MPGSWNYRDTSDAAGVGYSHTAAQREAQSRLSDVKRDMIYPHKSDKLGDPDPILAYCWLVLGKSAKCQITRIRIKVRVNVKIMNRNTCKLGISKN